MAVHVSYCIRTFSDLAESEGSSTESFKKVLVFGVSLRPYFALLAFCASSLGHGHVMAFFFW